MAKVKDLKREINDLTYEVVSDCFTYLLVNEKKNEEKVVKIITEAVNTRNDFIARVNRLKKEKDTNKREGYRKIREELCSDMNKAFESLSKLSSKK
jgi:hypothetical protein